MLTRSFFKLEKLLLLGLLFCTSCSQNTSKMLVEEGMREINGTELFYKRVGVGEPILVVHGGPGLSHDYLYKDLVSLGKEKQVIFYDQRVCGKSSLELEPETITLENFAKDIEAIRVAFEIDKIVIMAHSWGGLLGMQYAYLHPGKVRALILVNSVGASSDIANHSDQLLAQGLSYEDSVARAEIIQSEALRNGDPIAIAKLMKIGFRQQFYDPSYLDSLDLGIDSSFLHRSRLLQNLAKDLTEFDFHAELKKIIAPTLLIYSSHDPLTTLAAEKLKTSIPRSELVVFENCGHFPFIEKREAFKKAVLDFLGEI